MCLRRCKSYRPHRMISFFLNLPNTAIGIIVGVISLPVRWRLVKGAVVINCKNFWWARGYMRGARAAAIGYVILLSPKIENLDLEHELVHVDQHRRYPLIFPILYYIELLKSGYRNNKFEDEAYRLSGNKYYSK